MGQAPQHKDIIKKQKKETEKIETIAELVSTGQVVLLFIENRY